MIFVWIFAAIGVLATGLFIAFLLDTPSEGQTRRDIAPVRLSQAQRDARAIRDHRRLVVQYKNMIDELYDYGEDVVKRKSDQE